MLSSCFIEIARRCVFAKLLVIHTQVTEPIRMDRDPHELAREGLRCREALRQRPTEWREMLDG
jgi:hypothetical protein